MGSAKLWKEVQDIQRDTGAVVYGNSTAWWNAEISIAFLRFHFSSRTDPTKKVLLLWDDFSAHWTPLVTAYAAQIGVVLMRIPPGYTWIAQPADVVWNHTLKYHIRRKWLENLRNQIANHEPPAKFELKAPSRSIIAKWIYDSWTLLKPNTIRSGFRKCSLIPLNPNCTPEEEASFKFYDTKLVNDLVQIGVAEEVEAHLDILSDNSPDVAKSQIYTISRRVATAVDVGLINDSTLNCVLNKAEDFHGYVIVNDVTSAAIGFDGNRGTVVKYVRCLSCPLDVICLPKGVKPVTEGVQCRRCMAY
ncbi:hypothetical protein ACHHYP_20657 [Achlya hypogyna]|uniref:DDE-1 domain-containing protein n=1 Tax=Achlya hypogyna TaxID=1202772 RepID=A0A1V9ZFT9_ACHHY|nr:hypothetical protein ACHHYP_20657 [Achlya hypogyna]